MSTVVLPYNFPTGTVLDPDQMNRDVHSTVDGESVYGELDGHLQDVNFAGGFAIRPEHMRYGEQARLQEDSLGDTLDYYDDFTPNDGSPADNEYTPIAGTSTRIYLPYNVTCAVYAVSMFYTVYRCRQREIGSQADVRTGPPILLKMWIDGKSIPYTTRQTPITYWPENLDGANALQMFANEYVLTQHYDINHLAINGATADETARCTAGYHTVSMRLYIPVNTGQETMTTPYSETKKGGGTLTTYNMGHRFRCGVRSARIVGLL